MTDIKVNRIPSLDDRIKKLEEDAPDAARWRELRKMLEVVTAEPGPDGLRRSCLRFRATLEAFRDTPFTLDEMMDAAAGDAERYLRANPS